MAVNVAGGGCADEVVVVDVEEEEEWALWLLEELMLAEVDTPVEVERVSLWLELVAGVVDDTSLLGVWPFGEKAT